jgi:hypothetical protein
VASVEWVTITPNVVGSVKLPIVLELWFHPQPAGPPDNAIVEQLVVQVFDERTGTRLAIVAPVAGGSPNPQQDTSYGNVWHLTIRPPRQFTGYLRLVFDAGRSCPTTSTAGCSPPRTSPPARRPCAPATPGSARPPGTGSSPDCG